MISENREVVLELQEVSLSYAKGKNVLNNVSMKLFEGQTLGIIGKNGCGKTSILRLLAGILSPSQGSVSRKRGTTAALLSIGLGFKSELSGRDNSVLSAMLQGLSKADAQMCVDQIRDFSELGDAFEAPVKSYSTGMRSRLGFSIALLTKVDILLIDEVLSVGDAQFKEKAQVAMQEKLSGEQAVVFVSHSANQIAQICNHAVWLSQGEIASEGEPGTVLDQYRQYLRQTRQPGISISGNK